MTDKRLCQLFAGLVAVMLLATAAAPLTAFGDDLPPPAASSVDVTSAPPEPSSAETSSSDTTAPIETSPADSNAPEPSSEALPQSSSTEVASSSEPPLASSSSSTSSTPDANPPLGVSNLPLGTSVDLLLESTKAVNRCYIGATVSFAPAKLNPANGDPIVTLKLERIGENAQAWFITKRFSGGTLSQEFEFPQLSAGRYRLTQLPVLRYQQLDYRFYDVTSWNSIVSGDGVVATFNFLLNGSNGHANIRNKDKTDLWFSDTDIAVNRIMLPCDTDGGDDDNDD